MGIHAVNKKILLRKNT